MCGGLGLSVKAFDAYTCDRGSRLIAQKPKHAAHFMQRRRISFQSRNVTRSIRDKERDLSNSFSLSVSLSLIARNSSGKKCARSVARSEKTRIPYKTYFVHQKLLKQAFCYVKNKVELIQVLYHKLCERDAN